MRISDWSSEVCSSDLMEMGKGKQRAILDALLEISIPKLLILLCILAVLTPAFIMTGIPKDMFMPLSMAVAFAMIASFLASQTFRSEEHTSELQSLMRISYAVFCLKQKK